LEVRVDASSYIIVTDGFGHFALSGLPAGAVQISVKNTHTLSNRMASVTLAPGLNVLHFGLLREGDANNDDVVDITDFSIWRSTFGRAEPRGDFNQDGIVVIVDFSLLRSNFGKHGPLPASDIKQ